MAIWFTDFRTPLPILFTLVLLGISACGVNTRDADQALVRMTEVEFSNYVEQVFRYHNGIVNELILASSLSEDVDVQFAPQLIRAEAVMVRECHLLNQIVSATIEGRELGLWSKLRLPGQVPRCAAASRSVEPLIPAY